MIRAHVWLSVMLFGAVLGTTNVFAKARSSYDPFTARSMEQLTKAAQARKMRQQLVLKDFSSAPAVTVERYDFDLNVFPKDAKITGTVTIALKASDDVSVVNLDALGLKINEVWFHDRFSKTSRAIFKSEEEGLQVQLPAKITKDQTFSLQVFYEATGDRRSSRATETEKGLFFVNTAQGLAATSGPAPTIYTSTEPQLARSWFPCIDDPAYKAKQVRMRVTVPKGFTVVSNGVLTKNEHLGEFDSFEWQMDKPIATYLVSLAIAQYKMHEDRWQDVPVQYFAPEKIFENAKYDQARTPEMIDTFSKLWGRYPYAKYSTAIVPYYDMAMEHTTCTTAGDSFINGRRTYEELFAHELAHHWWGDLVTAATWDDLWLNEGFATYAEVVYTGHFKGAEAEMNYLIGVQESYFSSDRDGTQSVVDKKTAPDDKFNSATYEKGGWVVHMLRQAVGDDAFSKSLQKYLERFAYGNAETSDLEKAFEEVSGKDLSLFFKQWVYGKGYPALKASWKILEEPNPAGSTVSITLEQKQKGDLFQLPVDVLIAYKTLAGGKAEFTDTVNLSGKISVSRVLLPRDAASVIGMTFDPNVKILKRVYIDDALPTDEASAYWVAHANPFVRWGAITAIAESKSGLLPWVQNLEHEKSAIVRQATLMALAPKEVDAASTMASSPMAFTLDDAMSAKVRKLILLKFLLDSESDVRLAAAKAVGRFARADDAGILFDILKSEESPRVKAELVKTVATNGLDAYGFLADEFNKHFREPIELYYLRGILGAMGKLREPAQAKKASEFLMKVTFGEVPDLRRSALENLGKLKQPDSFSFIVRILNDEDAAGDLRLGAIEALVNYGGLPSARALDQRLKKEEDEDLKEAISGALKRLGGKPPAPLKNASAL